MSVREALDATVYLLASGERGEGHTTISVHATLVGAKSALRRHVPNAVAQRQGDGVWITRVNMVDEYWIYRMVVTA